MTWIPIAILVALAMEPWSRVVHKHAWHGPLYKVHASHHEPSGLLEANDVFAVLHAVPACAMIVYGLEATGLGADLAFGVGIGMTAFGASYALIHEGLIHERFNVSFLLRFRWLARIRAAHRAHHITGEEPYGLFLGPQELQQRSRRLAERRSRERAASSI